MRMLIVLLLALAAPADSLVSLSFSMRGDRARGWPTKVHVTLASAAGKTTERTIEAGEARKPVSLQVVPGTYRMTIAAEHHRVYTRTIEVGADLSLPEIALAPIPAVSGRVIERIKDTEVPLAGAQILADTKQLATTNEQGVFRVELTGDVPDSITVAHAGQAPKTVPLFENLGAENELGAIELPRGVTLTVLLDRRYREPKTLAVSVLAEKKTIATVTVPPSKDRVGFDHLAPAVYQIVVKGPEPLEAVAEPVQVDNDDVEHEVTISPFALDGRVLLGNEPLRDGGTIEIVAGDAWKSQVAIDGEGQFGGTMWQSGVVTGWVRTRISSVPLMQTSPELGGGVSKWTIALKHRVIQGRVFDAETKEPASRASVELEVIAGRERRAPVTVPLESDGSYSLLAMQNGTYLFRAAAADHAELRKTVMLAESDEGRIVDFPLDAGVETTAWFVWPDNQPVANAAVVATADGRALRTDAEGKLRLRLNPGTSREWAILPREGSFALFTLAAPRSGAAKPVEIVVPLPVGSLRVGMFDRKHVPVRRQLYVDTNGRTLPPAVLERLAVPNTGDGSVRLRGLPAGMYGVWMMGGPATHVAITTGDEAVELVAVR